jgi:2-methylcitrate dehydratase PrpD
LFPELSAEHTKSLVTGKDKMDAIQLFAQNFIKIQYEDLPQDVVDITKKEILDFLGVALAGYDAPGAKELADLLSGMGGKEESSAIGHKKKLPAPVAAQINATMGHGLDFDDVHDLAVMHPAVPIVPACLAVSESLGEMSGKKLITAVALGVDMICRLALAAWPGYDPLEPETKKLAFQAERVKNGWHLTTVMGYLAAAGSTAKLIGLDEAQMVNAFGLALHQCSGSHQGRDDGAHSKRLGPGFASRGGVLSSLMAQKGIMGAKNVLEGPMGLYQMYFQGGYDPLTLTADLGQHFEGINVSFKPYPCCRGTHTNIDAALALVRNEKIKPEDVKAVKIFVDTGGHQMLCSPWEVKAKPRTPVDAQFSIPWGVAAALARGQVGIEHYSDAAIESQDILEIAGKTTVALDHSLDTSHKTPTGRVEIKTATGKNFTSQVEYPLGSPENEMTLDDCIAKFRSCADYSAADMPHEKQDAVIEMIKNIEHCKDAGSIMELLR